MNCSIDAVDVDALFSAAGLSVFERGWLSSNNVLFSARGGSPATLVDSGYWSHQEQTLSLVRRALGPDRQLERLVNTHLHSDHCGGNAILQRNFGCATVVPAGEFERVERWLESELTYQATGQHCPRFDCDGRLRAGESIEMGGSLWDIVASPGHDPESVMLHEPSLGILISADALWEDGFGVVFPELEGYEAFDDVRRTLDLISGLKVLVVVPGHGPPFINAPAALERAYSRLDRFVSDPRKHALHAAKVLIKFHMLEVQAQSLNELDNWLGNTPYFAAVHVQYFADRIWREWRTELIDSLIRSRAVALDNGVLKNL